MRIAHEEANSKNKLLNSVAAGGVEQVSGISQRWAKFDVMMESFAMMIDGQVYQVSFILLKSHELFLYIFSSQRQNVSIIHETLLNSARKQLHTTLNESREYWRKSRD